MSEKVWIALAIGNSRYHWAWFLNHQLQSSWDTAYLSTEAESIDLDQLRLFQSFSPELQSKIFLLELTPIDIPIYLVSVVASQTALWHKLPQVKQIILADVPISNLYPTLGIDRAAALLGAATKYSYPVLVIDGGTALTLTGVDQHRSLVGGAIMPGLRLQFQSLFKDTSALPEVELQLELPSRWSNNTHDAIASGILYTIITGIRDFILDWERLFPDSQIILTGGDGATLNTYLQPILPKALAQKIRVDRELIFEGILAIVTHNQRSPEI